MQIRAFIEWLAPKLHCHNRGRPAAVPLNTARFERFSLFGLGAYPLAANVTTSATTCRGLRRGSRVVAADVAWVQAVVGLVPGVQPSMFRYAARALSMRSGS